MIDWLTRHVFPFSIAASDESFSQKE
jgi:hypothetical protein